MTEADPIKPSNKKKVHPGTPPLSPGANVGNVDLNQGHGSRRVSKRFSSLSLAKSKYVNLSGLALFSGAFLCFIDLICDLIMVREFIMNKQFKSANATVATLVVSLSLQIMIVYVQNANLPKRIVLREILFVVLCVKVREKLRGVINKYRVSANATRFDRRVAAWGGRLPCRDQEKATSEHCYDSEKRDDIRSWGRTFH